MPKIFQCNDCPFQAEEYERISTHLDRYCHHGFHEVYPVLYSVNDHALPSARAYALLQAAAQFFPYYEQIKQEGIDAVNSAVNSAEMLLAEIERREESRRQRDELDKRL